MEGKDSLQSLANIKNIQKEFDFITDGLFLIKDTILDLNKYELFGKSGKSVKDVTLATRDLAKELEKAKKVNAELVAQQERQERVRRTSIKLTAEEKLVIQQKNAEAKREAAINLAANNSTEKAIALRAKLRAEVIKTDVTNVDRIKVLNDRINKLSEIEKRTADKQKAQGLNVGNYQGSAKIIVEAFERIRIKKEELDKSLGTSGPEGEQVRKEFEALNRLTADPRFLNISARVGDTTAELKFFVKELNRLEDSGLKNSKVYKDVQSRLAQLTDQIGDTKAEVKALASDTRSFDLFAGSVTFAADAFQTFAGAAQLAGASEESAAEATRTLVAIQSVANGVKGIANELTTKGTAANKLYNAVLQQGQIIFSKSTTTAQKFNATLKSLAVLGVAAVLIDVISKLDLFSDSSEQAQKEVDKLTDAISRQEEALKSLNESIEFEGKVAVEKIKQQSNDKNKIYLEEQKTRELQLQNILKQQEEINSKISKTREDLLKPNIADPSFYDKFSKTEKLRLEGELKALNERSDALRTEAIKQQRSIDLASEQEASSNAEERRDKEKSEAEKNADAAKRLKEKQLQNELDFENRRNEALYSIRVERLNDRLRDAERQAADENGGADAQIAGERLAAELRKQLANEEYLRSIKSEKEVQDGRIVIKKKTDEELKAAELIYQNGIKEIQIESAANEVEIEKATAEKIVRDKEKFLDEQERQAEVDRDKNVDDIELSNAKELVALDKKFAAGKIKEKAYNDEKIRLQLLYQAKLLKEEIAYTQKVVALAEARAKLTGSQEDIDKIAEAKRQLAKLGVDLEALEVEAVISGNDKKLASYENLFNKVRQIAGNAFDVIGGIINISSEKQKNLIQEQIDGLEKQKEKDIEVANQTITNAEEKEAAISVINQRAEAQKAVFEQRQRQADERKARFEKAATIAKIIIDTSAAVMAQLKIPGNILGAIAVGALGAAQLAIAIATPIPKYKHGGKVSKDGVIMVGDGYKHEGITMPDGTLFKSPDIPTLMWAKAGTEIAPDFDKMQLSNAPSFSVNVPMSNDKAIKKLGVDIVQAINNKREYHLSGMPRSKTYLKEGHNFRKYINDRT